MAVKHFGELTFDQKSSRWKMTDVQPHVCIKLKSIFPKIPKTSVAPFWFPDTLEMCTDLGWFIMRYPLKISPRDFNHLIDSKQLFDQIASEMERILMPDYKPHPISLRDGHVARDYQLKAAFLHDKTKRLLLGDDLGLGKTLSAILTFLNAGTLPAVVVVQTHLTRQWQGEIEKFTNLRTHIIKGTKPYNLPVADVYIMKYSCLAGWVDIFGQNIFRSVVFDEVQELRHSNSNKYQAAKVLAVNTEYCLGMSATPVYNYADEIYHILNLIKDGCLGPYPDFLREWSTARFPKVIISDPKALGTYLRDNYLFLRRTREEVGRELPMINKIVHVVGYDDNEVKKVDALATQLAMKIVSGSFMERGMAARELDLLVRQKTGVSKAREVAEYVKILVSNGEPIVLAGWHRDVYDIWKEHLKEFNPVFYTGTESEAQKEKAKQAFVNGDTDLFIISLRSGIGLDGLQKRCRTVVIGELDWSPQVHNQLIGRVDRDGQKEQVTAIFLVSEYGSDPVIIDLLGLKSSQAHGIINPLTAPVQTVTDESRIRKLAEQFLKKANLGLFQPPLEDKAIGDVESGSPS